MDTILHTTLPNGLQVIIKPIQNSKVATLNLMYRVGSRNEDPEHTGLAHYLEHLMFGGSTHAPHYDQVVQAAGGSNNAYTSSDVTSYWVRLPADRLETALWLESDRMQNPLFTEKVIETQRSVVLEEYKECILNQPYGDAWHTICKSAYEVHPYRWPTIGQCPEHIQSLTREHVVAFHQRFYTPSNAVLVVVGGVETQKTLDQVHHWFGHLSTTPAPLIALPQEPLQKEARKITSTGIVPQAKLYKTYHLPPRTAPEYPLYRVLSHLLTSGKTSLLHHHLVEVEALATEVESHPMNNLDPGLFIIEISLTPKATLAKVDERLEALLHQQLHQPISEKILNRAIRQIVTDHTAEQISSGEQADTLAWSTLLSHPHFYEEETERLKNMTLHEFPSTMRDTLAPHRSTTLYYQNSSK